MMICTECRVWPLAADDHFCSWCGASHLRYSARLESEAIPRDEYPPPVPLVVSNESATQEIVVLRVSGSEPWATALDSSDYPARLRPGEQRRFFLDVDTFAARTSDRVSVKVEVAHAGTRLVTLLLVPGGGQHGVDAP